MSAAQKIDKTEDTFTYKSLEELDSQDGSWVKQLLHVPEDE